MPQVGAPGSVSTKHGGPAHALNAPASPWANPWHREPSDWRALRGTTVTDAEIKSHKAQATLHDLANHSALSEQRAQMVADATAQAEERANYNQLNFINRALHASKPHLRAPTTQAATDLVASQKAAATAAAAAAAAAAEKTGKEELVSKLTELL
eukprot:gene16146-28517_t